MGKIIVNASVTKAFKPDMVNFNIHICKVGDNGRELIRANKVILDQLFERMHELNIDDESIKENSFRIVINREYVDNEYVEKGYKLESSYVLSQYIDYELMDGIRNMLTDLDLEFNITYELEDEEAIRDDLLGEAVEKSKQKAKVIASAEGMRVGEMLEVRYGADMGARPMVLRASGANVHNAEPSDIELTESVEVDWDLEK